MQPDEPTVEDEEEDDDEEDDDDDKDDDEVEGKVFVCSFAFSICVSLLPCKFYF